MSVEGGLVGVATSVGAEFGSVMTLADIRLPINEGPGPRLENTMPYILDTGNINTFSLAEQIIAEPQAPLVIQQAEEIALGVWVPEVNSLSSDVPDVFQSAFEAINLDPDVVVNSLTSVRDSSLITQNDRWVIPQVEPVIVPGIDFQPAPIISEPTIDLKPNPILEEQALPSASSQPENRPAVVQTVSQVLEQPAPQQQEIEEEVVETIKVENKEKDSEEEGVETKKFVEDEEVSSVRKHEIREAVSKAKQEANRLGLKGIAGWLVAKFMPADHYENRSQIIKKTGPDGSYEETIEAIKQVSQQDSEENAIEIFNTIVDEKKPVKRGKEGEAVGQQDVARVLKYKIIKPSVAQEVIVKRLIKKKVPGSLIQKNDLKTNMNKQPAPNWVAVVEEYKPAA